MSLTTTAKKDLKKDPKDELTEEIQEKLKENIQKQLKEYQDITTKKNLRRHRKN
jgi:hypothetical protein